MRPRPFSGLFVITSSQSDASVRQTAFRAATVQREFLTTTGRVTRAVPGSFHEFITRAELQASPAANDAAQGTRLDLAFDAGNATGIFGMTAARA